MGDTEEYFPRGGKKPKATHFKQSANFLGGIEKSEKKKRRPKKKSEDDDGYLSDDEGQAFDQSHKECAFGIRYPILKEGFLVLGRVCEVLETKVQISLPNKIVGSVMACFISESYNKQLEAYVNDKIEKVRDLTQMFRVGQYIVVKVLETTGRVMLSMMPQHVNGGYTHTDLYKGALLQGAVSSIEDHGYVIDLGIPNTRVFLSKDNVNPDIELDTGTVTWFCVKSVNVSPDSSIVALSNQLDALRQTIQRQTSKTPLLPGTAVEFVVHKPLENGIEGHMLGDRVAYVQRQHTHTVKGKKPAIGQKVRARVLYVMPIKNTPFLTMKNIFEHTYPDIEKEQKFKEGDVIDDAQVIKITGRSVIFKLCKESTGLMRIRHLQVHEDLGDEEVIAKSYPIGSTQCVRVLCYNLSDFTYSVSDDPKLMKEQYFSVSHLTVGQIVDGKVIEVADSFIRLNVGRVSGLVPHAHLTDAGVVMDPKKGSIARLHKKKYKEGQEVKARVLVLDPAKQHALFTLKPTLLDPELEVLHSYEQAQIGSSYTGIVKYIKDFVLVSFFNNVTAFVPRVWTGQPPPEDIAVLYHVGQIVKCTIMRVDIETKKMTGSFITGPFDPDKKKENHKKRNQDTTNSEVPNKKHKTEDNGDKKKTGQSRNKENSSDTEINKIREVSKKDKKNKKKLADNIETENDENIETENYEISDVGKQKKINNSEVVSKGKNNKIKLSNTDEQETNLKDRKKKKDRKKSVLDIDNEEISKDSEESDPIDTDIHDEDSDQILKPEDMALVDLSDCVTHKKCKKRVVSLLKSVNARAKRIDRIEQKIIRIEEKGLDARNKKFHTAMHMEKAIVQERMKILLESLKEAQGKLTEFKDYKKEKKLKKEKNRDIKTKESTSEKKKKEVSPVETTLNEDIPVLDNIVPLEVPSAKDFWSANTETLAKKIEKDLSSSSEDEDEEMPKKKRKKLTVAEKIAKAREEEERVREMEKRAAEGNSQPRSADHFERALLANSNCSQLWIAYMAFHLQATEIEKARAVGRKALNTISFREEQEKLNVWLALINVENRFGTQESQQKTLEEALRMNDPFKVHSKLLDIYVETSKPQELASLVHLMLKKYRRETATYTLCGAACYHMGLVDKARYVMQKAMLVLDKKEHVPVLVQFALMERAQGDAERAETLFEQVLAVYPQRVDVCCAYVDMLLKGGDIQPVRQLMERIISQKLPARKMKVLFNKWVEAEEKIGDKEQVEKIQQRVQDYIDNAKF